MLTFVGLGLYDIEDISAKGLKAIRNADMVYLEAYTSLLTGTSPEEMVSYYGKELVILKREDVEQHPEMFLKNAVSNNVVFLTGGDPMVSTTHIDLRIRAAHMEEKTEIIHGSSIVSAVCGLSGLQNYRFGKSCSLPFPHGKWCPTTPAGVIGKNMTDNLHTIVYLDIQESRYMTISEAVNLLEPMTFKSGFQIPCYIGIARAGSGNPGIRAGSAEIMRNTDFGGPLHILVIPAGLHDMEREYLEVFAGYGNQTLP
ncbi:MAG: diphthine synthase [Methanoregulaceae archaeon]|nr:diphthine synthase [Methanoregulaceae archaeon]